MASWKGWRTWAHRLNRESATLYLAFRHQQTPWKARAVVLLVLAYLLSPIDLIPDSLPLLGYLDDLVIVPVGIALALRMVPAAVLVECRERADSIAQQLRTFTRIVTAVVLSSMIVVMLGIILLISVLVD
jgi:uncharacterized membrane protein YkvA (DUF1232 family)